MDLNWFITTVSASKEKRYRNRKPDLMRKSNHKIEYNKSFTSGGIPNLSPAKALGLCRAGAVIIDIRGDYITAFKKFDVPEVIYFTKGGRQNLNFENLDKNRVYIVAETSTSINSREIVGTMVNKGFKSVYNLAGGFVEWERDGLPVLENKKARLSGSCMCQLKPRNRHRPGVQHDRRKQ